MTVLFLFVGVFYWIYTGIIFGTVTVVVTAAMTMIVIIIITMIVAMTSISMAMIIIITVAMTTLTFFIQKINTIVNRMSNLKLDILINERTFHQNLFPKIRREFHEYLIFRV